MMRAIKLSVALLLAACLLSGCYMHHPDKDRRRPDGPQQQQKGAY
jgi:outer membrane biogenesis lipoprotein LolB